MNQGKIHCDFLKKIRLQIAQENDIPLAIEECTFEGNCKGTCPRCEAELNYLEHKMEERKWSGKKAIVAGISLGLLSTITSCNFHKQTQQDSQNQNDSISNVSIVIDTVNENEPRPGQSENVDRKVISVSEEIYELAGVSPDLPEVDTQYLRFMKGKVEINRIDSLNMDSVEMEK